MLVDDGLATGATMVAAARWARAAGARRVVAAVPGRRGPDRRPAPAQVDDVVCLRASESFGAVGFWYVDFDQVDDREVIELLEDAAPPPVSRRARMMEARTITALGVARELVLVGFAAAVYGGVRAVTEGSVAQAVANAEAVDRIERTLGIAWESAAQSLIIGSETLVTLANWVYIWGHWPVIIAAAVFLYTHRPTHYRVLRNAMIASGLIGFVFFYVVPTAPPRLAGLGLTDTVLEQSHSYRALQPPSLTNQYAAMPSLHFGWNLLVGIVLFTAFACLAVRVFAVAMPVAMGFAVVATANHFVLDVAAGMLVVALGLALALALERSRLVRARRAPGGYAESEQSRAPAAATLSPPSELANRQRRDATQGVSFLRRAPGRKRPCAPACRRGALARSRRGRHPPLPRAPRGASPEDPRPDSGPLGPLAARQPLCATAPAARAASPRRARAPS